jgi:NAD(P)-dependent dehydrogenase (short-subunit alcohol dehydrogenase family)
MDNITSGCIQLRWEMSYTDTIRRSISRNELVRAKNENRMKRLSQPEEVGKSIVSLKGENFSFSTGNTIIIDGGKVII